MQTQQKHRSTTPKNEMGHFYMYWKGTKENHETF
jgi:hypothetical protein